MCRKSKNATNLVISGCVGIYVQGGHSDSILSDISYSFLSEEFVNFTTIFKLDICSLMLLMGKNIQTPLKQYIFLLYCPILYNAHQNNKTRESFQNFRNFIKLLSAKKTHVQNIVCFINKKIKLQRHPFVMLFNNLRQLQYFSNSLAKNRLIYTVLHTIFPL